MSRTAEFYVDTKFDMALFTLHSPKVDLVSTNTTRTHHVNASSGGSASTRPLAGVTHARDTDWTCTALSLLESLWKQTAPVRTQNTDCCHQ